MHINDIKFFLGIEEDNIKIIDFYEQIINNRTIKYIKLDKDYTPCICPTCGSMATRVHDYKLTHPKHIKINNHPSILILNKRRLRCTCGKRFFEPWNFVDKHKRVTKPLIHKMLLDLRKKRSFKDIAYSNNVSFHTLYRYFINHINYDFKHITLPSVISIDEFRANTYAGKYACIIVDPINKHIITILPNRRKDFLIKFFSRIQNRNIVEVVIGDMWDTYRDLTERFFPKALYIADRFHFVRHILWAFTDIRVRVQSNLYKNNIKDYRFLKDKKTVKLINMYSEKIEIQSDFKYEYNSRRQEYKLDNFQIIDKALSFSMDLKEAYELKELFLQIINNCTYENAEEYLIDWINECHKSGIKEFIKASNTIKSWLPYIVNSFYNNGIYSNGYIEGVNNKIKCIKRISFGYKNFYNFKNRIMYIFGNPIVA